jgi:hypothetical protein
MRPKAAAIVAERAARTSAAAQAKQATRAGNDGAGKLWDWALGFGRFIYTWMHRILSHLGGPDCARPSLA